MGPPSQGIAAHAPGAPVVPRGGLPDDPDHQLTARQQEFLKFVAEGRTAKEVAAKLGISVRTAEAHKANVLEALGLTSTMELVQYAIRKGIISA